MRVGQGVRTGLGHGGTTCVLQTQFSSFFLFYLNNNYINEILNKCFLFQNEYAK